MSAGKASFVDREAELDTLERSQRNPGGNLVIVLGRRRLGKTRLLSRFCEGRKSLMVYVREGDRRAGLRHVAEEILRSMGEEGLVGIGPSSIDGFLNVVERFLRQDGQPVLVLDEFQNLASRNRPFLSALQERWDLRLRETRSTLVLCGSAVGMIEDLVNAPKSPLYGRKTAQVELRPLPFGACDALLPEARLHDRILRYAVTGGVPYYLEVLRGERDLKAAVEDHILRYNSTLYDEPRAAIHAETREPDRYFTILEALAAGATRPNEIADRTEIPLHQITAYLPVLCDHLLVERRVALTERRERSRNSLYRVADPFFRFWFACVSPNKSFLERGEVEPVSRQAFERLPALAGPVFEDIVRDLMVANSGSSPAGLLLDFTRIGGWWNRQGEEVDVLAMGGPQGPIAMEVKLGIRPVGRDVVEQLVGKRASIGLRPPVRLGIATAGSFTPAAKDAAREHGVRLLDGAVIASMIRHSRRPRIRGAS
jgi:AAA+ ATPase superfamily predicted ATPase